MNEAIVYLLVEILLWSYVLISPGYKPRRGMPVNG